VWNVLSKLMDIERKAQLEYTLEQTLSGHMGLDRLPEFWVSPDLILPHRQDGIRERKLRLRHSRGGGILPVKSIGCEIERATWQNRRCFAGGVDGAPLNFPRKRALLNQGGWNTSPVESNSVRLCKGKT
jgi:hypothetical protein